MPPNVHQTSFYVGVFTRPSTVLIVIEGLGKRLEVNDYLNQKVLIVVIFYVFSITLHFK